MTIPLTNRPSSYNPITSANMSATSNVGFISPDAILAYVASKLRDTDGQMQAIMGKQRKMEGNGEALTDLANVLGEYQQNITNGDQKAEVEAAYQAAIDRVGPDTELGRKLLQEKKAFQKNADHTGNEGDNLVGSNEMKDFLDNVSRLQSSVNQGGEMMMMKLQSLASLRQQVLQASTNFLSGIGQTSNAIASNIGK